MNIQLSEHFNYKKLLRFTIPSVIMMIFTSIYGVVDGFFVSNYVGKIPFAAINFIYPVIMILGCFGFMFGAGGSAVIARTMGEGNPEKANGIFSFIVYLSIVISLILAIIGIAFLPQFASLMGAEGQMHTDAVVYARILLLGLPFLLLQFEFQTFFVTAEKPVLGLVSTLLSGFTNMFFDWLFMAVFRWGIEGAAVATALSQVVGGVIPLFYFGFSKSSILRLGRALPDFRALLKTVTNGSSELMSNISMSLVGILYNIQLLKFAGEDGVAAYGVLMYVNFVFVSAFIGYSVGVAPVISFHYGAQNHGELKSLFKKSCVIIGVLSLGMFILSEAVAYPFSYLFVGYDRALLEMTLRGFFIFSFSFLFSGFAIFGSGFFTALNDGVTSAIISLFRTLIFQLIAILVFPVFWGIDGIWVSNVVAEFLAVVLTVYFVVIKRGKYKYF